MKVIVLALLIASAMLFAVNVGDPAPDFTLKDIDNVKTYHLYDYMGNAIFLNWFWTG